MSQNLLLLGHRGARRYAPENTVEAFELALEHGCDGFEFDVRFTADRQCVVCHDPRFVGRTIAKSQLSELGTETPRLADVLQRFAHRAFLDIELKVTGAEAEVALLLRQYPPQQGYFVSSFLPEVVECLCAADNALPLGLICKKQRQLDRWPSLPIHAVFLEQRLLSPALVETFHAVHKKVFVWTVDERAAMLRFAEMGVDGIISGDTTLLVRTLRPTEKC